MLVDTYRRRAWEFSTGQYGFLTTVDAKALGIPVVELGKLAARGHIRHVSYGLYRFDEMPASRFDQFFESVARVGGDAHLTGDAVLALHNLALVNPRQIKVGTSRRVRARLPEWMTVIRETVDPNHLTCYEMIPSVTVARAIASCKGAVMADRLRAAVVQARSEGLITPDEEEELEAHLEMTT